MSEFSYPGATVVDGGVAFLVWAPRAESVELHLHGGHRGRGAPHAAADDRSPEEGSGVTAPDLYLPMAEVAHTDRNPVMAAAEQPSGEAPGRRSGYFAVTTERASAGTRYTFRLNGEGELPDPASSSQPEGVHKPSAVVDHAGFTWTDYSWLSRSAPVRLDSHVIYELHVGAFTPEGTFDAAASRLADLADLGITAVEVMPVAQFPGTRNWGYDGTYPFAVQNSYGGPEGFRRYVDRAHAKGIAVVLDVVYNHFGPEGNYSGQFAHYFTDRYRTPWGSAVNVDGPGSDEVRRFFLANLRHWMERFHVDGFRLDAVHEIHDESAVPFLADVSQLVSDYGAETGTYRFAVAESDLNDRRVVAPRSGLGFGLDATWSDDFHHGVHARVTGEQSGYFSDFGDLTHIARSLEHGWSYTGQHSQHRKRRHGNSPEGVVGSQLVFCTQNHDQIGNRMRGERLVSLAGIEADRLSRSLLLLAPFVPLLFMGQEYGEDRPFLYVVDHGDPDLLAATREGRAREFAAFHAHGTPPDPGDPATLAASVLRWDARTSGAHHIDLELTRELLSLRRRYDCFRPAAVGADAQHRRRARVVDDCVILASHGAQFTGIVLANFGEVPCALELSALKDYLAVGLIGSDAAESKRDSLDNEGLTRVFLLSDFVRSGGKPSLPNSAAWTLELEALDVWAGVVARWHATP